VIISLPILIQYQLVTDGLTDGQTDRQTDGYTPIAYTAPE